MEYKVGDEIWVKAKVVSSDASGCVVVVSPNAQPVENIEELQSRITALESALAAEREKTRWVPVGEGTLDENTVVVIRVSPNFTKVITHHIAVLRDGAFNTTRYIIPIDLVTHYMPLPEPPKEGEE